MTPEANSALTKLEERLEQATRLLELVFDPAPSLSFMRLNIDVEAFLAGDAVLTDQRTALEERLKDAEDRNRKSFCTYCGHVATGDSPEHVLELIKEHVFSCEKHPMRRIAFLLEAADAVVAEASDPEHPPSNGSIARLAEALKELDGVKQVGGK